MSLKTAFMKNITLSIPEDLIKQGREYAAKQGTTLNELIRKLLKATVQADQQTKANQIISEMKKLKSPMKSIQWSREDLYER
jgi:metal-responsive CopG/Arc/MetJ family transcriptional regulator